MQKKWNILPFDLTQQRALAAVLKINPILCKLLVQRGYTTYEKARDFFRPSIEHLHQPWLMKDMEKAVARILLAFERKEKILIYGDYDVDGTTSVACVFSFLKEIHPWLDFYIPHRYKEGYGISKTGIDFAKKHQFSLIISLDCGIKSVDLVDYANTLGIDFVICDHHLPDEKLPNAIAILNPKQKDCAYPYKELCGCGVGFKLMQALSERLNLAAESYLQYLDLVATAIAADIVPIDGENRVLAYYGLEKINHNPSVGIQTLLELAEKKDVVTISNLVFIIAPRINAAGRMDDAKKAVKLFIEKNKNKALQLAQELHQDNTERREADNLVTLEALEMIESNTHFKEQKTTVLFQPHWHKGIVGIVASRLIEKYYKPTIILTEHDGIVSGSARSVHGFNLYEAVHACKDLLLGYGGHFAAAGLSLLPSNVKAFAQKFEEVVCQTITSESLNPVITIDTEVSFKDINLSFYNIIHQMEPFGPANMRPIFMAKKIEVLNNTRILKEKHVRFVLQQGGIQKNGIGFNMAEQFMDIVTLQGKKYIDIVFSIELNEWKNQKNIQLKIIDFR